MRNNRNIKNNSQQPNIFIRLIRGIIILCVRIIRAIFRFIAWPFKHLYITIPVLILAYLIPTFIGARPAEVHIWYWKQIKKIFSPVSEQINTTGKALIAEAEKTFSIPEFLSKKEKTPTIKDKMVDTQSTPQMIRRQMFEKASKAEVAVKVDTFASEQNKTINTTPPADTNAINAPLPADSIQTNDAVFADIPLTPEPVPEAPKPVELPKPRELPTVEPDLIKLSTPQEFSGSAYIINANELSIGGNSIFLYGIYVDPNSREGYLGAEFLKKLIGNDTVHCIAPAYTKQGVATAICTVRDININYLLVENGISKNVSLPTQ